MAADGTNVPGDLSVIEVSGLDQRNGSLSSPRGSLRDCLNFEVDQQGGLVGSKGWAKYDGTVMGPDLDQFVVIAYNPGALTGSFRYAELVRLVTAGLPALTCICLGAVTGTFNPLLVIAFPYADYPDWVDPTSFGLATTVTGLTSGATLSAILSSQDMTDPSITVAQYNSIRKQIQALHSATVLPVPGDSSRPIDCTFGFSNDVYAIHDCLMLPFNNGSATFPLYPVEGHWVRDNTTGQTLGRILEIHTDGTGNWESGIASGYIVFYDQSIPAPSVWPPPNGNRLDLYDANNVVQLISGFARSAIASRQVAPRMSRALLYKTTDQQVATQTLSYLPPPSRWQGRLAPQIPNPRTWTRPRLTREIPYTQKYQALTTGVGFAPVGANNFSIYEYSRAGLTQQLQAATPITAPEKFPTVATAASTGGTSWVNPNNIFADDGVFTTNTGTSAGLRGSGFDFSFIPPGSRILGLSVRIKGLASVANVAYFQHVQLSLPDPQANPNFGTGWRYGVQDKGGPTLKLSAANTSYTFGGNTDLWGETITPEMLQDPAFGVVVSMARSAAATVSLDCMTVTVTYVPPQRTVYIRNTGSTSIAVTDVPVQILHYSIDNGSFTDAGNPAQGVLTFWVQTTAAGATATEGDATNAGMARVIGAGEEIWTGPGGTGTLLGYTNGGHYPISFPPGTQLTQYQSRYEVINANFYDDVNARAAFIVNGVEFCTMFDGTYTLHARTGRPTDQDNPRHVTDHLGYLHLGFASGAVVNCGTKRPLSVIGAPGSNTYNFGEPVTGLKTLNGQTLGVWTDRRTRGLQGSSPAPELGGYTPIIISPAIGCIEFMLADVMGEAVWMSYRGVETLQTVTAYGDFQTQPLSTKATPWLRERIQADQKLATTPARPVYGCGVRNERQYKAFFGDGFVFTLTMFDPGKEPECTIQCLGRAIAAATFPDYGVQTYLRAVVRSVAQVVRTDGKEQIFATFENLNTTVIGVPLAYFPYVAQLNCGTQFDIALDMPRWVDFNGLYFGDPQQQRKNQSMTVFVNALAGTQMRAYTLINFDGPMDLEPLTTSDPNVNTYRIVIPQYPAATARVYLPAPQVFVNFDIPSTGRMLRLRIDANQDVDSDTTTLPVRLTHIAFQSEGQNLDRA